MFLAQKKIPYWVRGDQFWVAKGQVDRAVVSLVAVERDTCHDRILALASVLVLDERIVVLLHD